MRHRFVQGVSVWVILGMVVVAGGVLTRPASAETAGSATASGAAETVGGAAAGETETPVTGTVGSVPNYWPTPDGCKKMVPAGGEACDGCCRTTVNTWLSPWCAKYTKPGPERDECNQDATNWFIWCVQDCAGGAVFNP